MDDSLGCSSANRRRGAARDAGGASRKGMLIAHSGRQEK